MKHLFFVLVMAISSTASPYAGAPRIGETCPDFSLSRVTHYQQNSVTLADFRGKWLILDFWSTTCAACIKSFPKINHLQQKFMDSIQFLLVGHNDSRYNGNIEEVFERIREKQGLNLAVAYDSVLAARWGVNALPHVVIIDPNGVVRHITDGRDMTGDKLQAMLEGVAVGFFPKGRAGASETGAETDNSESKLSGSRYHSAITEWKGEPQNGGYNIGLYADALRKDGGKAKEYALTMVHLAWLYNMAYHGQYHFKLPTDSNYAKIYHYPIVEVTDASPFEYSYTEDIGKGLYNYYLKLPPPQTKESVMRCMQEDLKRAFGFEATVERRKVSVWKMVANPDAASRLKTSGGEPVQPWAYGSIAAGFSARNISMSDCFVALIYHLADSEEYPFIDGTGISGNVDFTVEADMTDFGSVKRELQKQGLDFVKSEKEMTVLVIGEP